MWTLSFRILIEMTPCGVSLRVMYKMSVMCMEGLFVQYFNVGCCFVMILMFDVLLFEWEVDWPWQFMCGCWSCQKLILDE